MAKSCHCGKFRMDTAIKTIAPADWQAKEVLVCSECNLIHHAVQEAPRVVRGPANARALLNADGRSTGIHYLTWSVDDERQQIKTIEYYPYPRKIPMSHPEPLLFSLWELLQAKMSTFMDYEPDDNMEKAAARERAKYEARGMAETLAILMKPFVETGDDVVRHAARYYKDNTYEVPGLGLHLWDPLMNPDGTPRTLIATPSAKKSESAPKRKLGKQLTPEEAASIKGALAAGMFTPDQLAATFKVTVAQIEACR